MMVAWPGGGGVAGRYAVDWQTADFRAGDVVALAIDTFHMSAANRTNRIRVSCDTRWQPVTPPPSKPLQV